MFFKNRFFLTGLVIVVALVVAFYLGRETTGLEVETSSTTTTATELETTTNTTKAKGSTSGASPVPSGSALTIPKINNAVLTGLNQYLKSQVPLVNSQGRFSLKPFYVDAIGTAELKYILLGDLTGDRVNEGVAISWVRHLGSSKHVSIEIFKNVNGQPLHSASYYLGAGIAVKSWGIKDNVLSIERSIEDECGDLCPSGQYKMVQYRLLGHKLIQI